MLNEYSLVLRWIALAVLMLLALVYREQVVQITTLLLKTPPDIFLWALVLVIAEFVLQAWRMRLVFKKGWKEVLRTYAIGHFVAFSLPNRALGELARAGALAKLLSVPADDAMAYVGVERLLDVIVLLAAGSYLIAKVSLFLGAVVCLGVLAMLLALEVRRLNDLFSKLPWVVGGYFKSARKIVKNRGLLAKLLFLTMVLWLLDFLRVWTIVRTFGGNVGYPEISALVSLTYIIAVLSFLPGGLVVWEGGLSAGLVAMGMSMEGAIAATLLERFFSYWLWILVGALTTMRFTRESRTRITQS